MALVVADRVWETTSTSGTGTLTLSGAVSGYQTFAVIGNGNTTYYTITNGTDWEVGIGTYTSSGTTLSRGTVLSSSSGGSKINVTPGSFVFCDYPASKAVYEDASDNVTGYSISGGSINNTTIGATTASTGVFSNLTDTGLTSGRVTYASTGGNLVDSANLTFNGTTLTANSLGLTTPLSLTNGGTGSATANGGMANLMGFTSTATAAGTTTLDNTSTYYQLFTGSTTQTVVLPVTSTLQTGWTFHICNNSTGALTVNSSGGNLLISVIAGTTVMCTCIGTALTTAADWEAGYTDFSTATGTGSVVLSSSPSFTGISATGTLTFSSSTTSTCSFATSQTTGNTSICTSQSSGTLTIGGTSGTGTMTIGRSTVSQQTDIQAGATASGSTKTMNIGTAGLSGSTTNIAIGSAVSGATSRTTLNGIVIDSISAAVSAAGTTQGTATSLVSNINNITTVAASSGVVLPTAVAGMRILIRNTGANTLNIYPATGGTINALATNAAFTLAAGSTTELFASTTTQWYTF